MAWTAVPKVKAVTNDTKLGQLAVMIEVLVAWLLVAWVTQLGLFAVAGLDVQKPPANTTLQPPLVVVVPCLNHYI